MSLLDFNAIYEGAPKSAKFILIHIPIIYYIPLISFRMHYFPIYI